MSEASPIPSVVSGPTPPAAAWEHLSAEAARMAGLLSAHLGQLDLPESQQLLGFLTARGATERPPAPADGTLPIDRLCRGAGLTARERELLVLAGLAEEHEGYAVVLRRLHPSGEPYATVGLAAQLLCRSAAERWQLSQLLTDGAAVRCGLLRLRGEGPLPERGLSLGDGLWLALQGLPGWPAGLSPMGGEAPTRAPGSWWAEALTTRAQRVLTQPRPAVLLVLSDQEEVAFSFAMQALRLAGIEPAAFGPAALAPDRHGLLSAHCLARGQGPVIALPPEGPGESAALPTLGWEHPGPLVLWGRPGAQVPRLSRPLVDVVVPSLPTQARQELWSVLLPDLAAEAPRLATHYSIGPVTTALIATDVLYRSAMEGRRAQLTDVADCVRLRTHVHLPAGVKREQPRATWEHLVLAPDKLDQLREVPARLQHRGQVIERWGFLRDRPGARGVRILLSGPPGTGKTLSAEVLASELGVDMLIVDLSRVVSKWLGETEKNLARVFDIAEGAQAVLVFDEADALFGKRTEVSDAHDRYANLETAYLLSRLERFDGLTVLTTNLRQNIDPAFMRRLEFAIDFHEPGERERRDLWRCHVPSAVPCAGDVDLAELAALYPIVGGLIRNAAVAAGFLAAAQGRAPSRTHFIRAIRREYEKSGRAFPGDPSGRNGL